MIISHAKKFIFVRPRKVASSSIVAALLPHLEQGDVMAESAAEVLDELGQKNFQGYPDFRSPMRNFFGAVHPHIPLYRIFLLYGPRVWNYKIFSAVRNPWDRAVSEFFWNRGNSSYSTIDEIRTQFESYLDRASRLSLDRRFSSWMFFVSRDNELSQSHLYNLFGKNRADFFVRYERLAADVNSLGAYLELDQPLTLPEKRLKSSSSNAKWHWSEYYTAISKEIVASCCREEIECFSYQFETANS